MGNWKKTKGLDKWKTDGYYIEQTNDDPATMVVSTMVDGKLTGEVGTLTAGNGETPTQLLRRAKAACVDQQDEPRAAKLSIAGGALDWQETGPSIWEAGDYRIVWRTPSYHVEGAERVTLPEQANLAGAQLLCEQHHAGRGIEWEETEMGWIAEAEGVGYTCILDDDDEQWLAISKDAELGAGTPDEAQALCQINRGKRLLLEAAKATLPETAKTLGLDVGERDTKPEKPGQLPEPQRADWVIPMPLTEAEMAEAFEEGRKLRRRKRQLYREVAASQERHKRLAKHNLELIAGLEDEIEQLDEQMPERAVDCFRAYVRDGDEIWVQYLDLRSGDILHERKLEQHEQRQLFGEGDPPADKPPEQPADEEPVGAIEKQLAEPENQTAGYLEVIRQASARADARATAAEPRTPLDWKRFRLDDGQPAYRAEVPGGEYRVERQATGGPGKGLLVAFWAPADGELAELRGQHDKVADAKAEAEQHWQSRLRWPGDPASGLLVSRCGKYQLTRERAVPGFLPGERWHAEAIGGQDERNTDLGEHNDLAAAQAACQAHADAGRAGR